MSPSELKSLVYFTEGERDLAGREIDWAQADYGTMQAVSIMRQRLDSQVRIVRLVHPGKPTAVDWCCPGRSYRDVVMECLRVQGCSMGFYSGQSVHFDSRPFANVPARWLAIRPADAGALTERGIGHLVTSRASGWLYLQWEFRALALVVELASRGEQ